MSPNGKVREGFLLADLYLEGGDKFALALYCEKVDSEDRKEALTFMGGFDPQHVVHDLAHETKMLSLIYPTDDFENLKTQIGSIDYS
jgi:hypothetical protein